MATPLEYVRSELFDEPVDRHHRSYVLAVLDVRPTIYVSGPPAR
jgi:hypothetical protein